MTWLVSYDESKGVDEACLTVGHLYRDDNDKLQLDVIYTLSGDEANTMARIIADKRGDNMTRDAITEGNRILNSIKAANEFWKNHQYKNDVPDGLVSRIDATIEQYISDMEYKFDYLGDYFKYEDDKQ